MHWPVSRGRASWAHTAALPACTETGVRYSSPVGSSQHLQGFLARSASSLGASDRPSSLPARARFLWGQERGSRGGPVPCTALRSGRHGHFSSGSRPFPGACCPGLARPRALFSLWHSRRLFKSRLRLMISLERNLSIFNPAAIRQFFSWAGEGSGGLWEPWTVHPPQGRCRGPESHLQTSEGLKVDTTQLWG